MKLNLLASTLAAAALSLGVAQAANTTINAGGSSLAAPTYIALFKAYTASNPTILFDFAAAGSGAGQNAFLNNNINYFEPVSPTNTVGYAAGTLTYGTIVGTSVSFGASDAVLSASQLTNPATGSYAESGVDGSIIQIPTLGTPITIPYNESAVTSALKLTDAQTCGVLSGKITDWHTLVSTVAAGTTINVAYRSDSSGTTFLLTQHLNKVCTSANSSFPVLPVAVTKSFASLFTNSTPPANFTGESGSSNVAKYLVATSGGFGYLSPDYTSIAPKSANTTTLKVASLVNASNGVAYTPSVANTETGLANAGAGSTNPTPPSTLANAMDPLNWVPTVPVTTSGYPIVGYTTVDLSTCYANKTLGTALIGFFTTSYSSTYKTIITNNGFAPLANTKASPYANSIKSTFLTNSSSYNLNIDNATTCAGLAGR